ncbi:MAG: hypothetical protein HN742_03970 [Lentisphaerae bacterium]|nr:hypothetical protein [Lentisphaerota bacterium]MBT4822766.1 hypothetical protein [Lentisphaerota bacterium]MBT5604878.1 hypothetical protein [Lentisphaerota bacterium]MBT7054203.1 hypothetical protein [Lentisphaerota bacterium]MBT7841000.1 hypothetical protein [Lentisphaerota bacterium]
MSRPVHWERHNVKPDLMWEIWGLVGGLGRGEKEVRALADPDIRRQIVPIIHQARHKDVEAAGHIEKALSG